MLTSFEAGAETVVLCDTNGGMIPDWVHEVVASVARRTSGRLGMHAHNDTGCAVANTLAAVSAGAVHVQGTVNGYGERTGNADLLTVVANLEIKHGRSLLAVDGLREMIRNHIAWSRDLCERLRATENFEITSEPSFSLFSFRYAPPGAVDLDALNLKLVDAINADGRIYLTQTRLDDKVVIRFQVGQFECAEADVASAYDVIAEIARMLA